MLALCATVLPVVLLFCGLAVDVGLLHLKKVQMQNAADAGALGAELEEERGTGNWVAMGKADAGLNGFTDGKNNTTVTVQQSSTWGDYTTYYNGIQVTITQRVRSTFMGVLNGGYQTVTANATALVPPCVSFLGNGSQTQYSFQGASAGMNTTCPVAVNTALVVDGFSSLVGFGINVAGAPGDSNISGSTSQQSSRNTVSGSAGPSGPSYKQPVPSDLLANLAQPSAGSCTATSSSMTSGSITVGPGTYCGTSSTPGITISNATVNMLPGLYIITGGASLTNATVTGTGVTIFFTNGTNGAGYGQFLVNGSNGSHSSLSLSAAADNSNGAIPGVVIFADRNWVPTAAHDISFNTNTVFSGDGIWYAPHTGIYLWQNSFTVPNYGGIVADNIYFYNTRMAPKGNFSSLAGGSPFRTQAVLVQ